MHKYKNLIDWMMPRLPSLVCSIENAGDGDDGGSGGGDDKAGQIALSDEVKTFIGNTVNAALGSHLKRDSFQASLADRIAKQLLEAKQNEPDDKPGMKPDDKPNPKDLETAKLKSEMAQMRKQMEAKDAEAQKEKAAARTQAERSALTEQLRKAGVDDHRVAAANAFLYLDQQLITRNDADEICMRFRREWGEELVPLDQGVKEYLKSEQGKVFLPPVNTSGSGNTGGRPPAKAPGEKPTRAELYEHLGTLMMHGGQTPGAGQ